MSIAEDYRKWERHGEHLRSMRLQVNTFLNNHFGAGRTLAQLTATGTSIAGGQHNATWLIRQGLPATVPCTFIIKARGEKYERQGEDLYSEGTTMRCLGETSIIPIPRVYASYESKPEAMIAMEHVRGRDFDSVPKRWTQQAQNHFIRQMAVIRIQMLRCRAALIGGVVWPLSSTERKRTYTAGVMGGLVSHTAGRLPFRVANTYDRGPYRRTKDWAAGSLAREINYYAANQTASTAGWLQELRTLYKDISNMEANMDITPDISFPITHGDLGTGSNIMIKGTKIVSIIDWESANFVPFSEAIQDLAVDLDKNGNPMLPTVFNDVQAIEHNYNLVGEYGSQIGSEIGSDGEMGPGDDGVSMYAHTDEEGANEYENGPRAALLGKDWYTNEAMPRVYHLVHQWFQTFDKEYSTELIKGSDIVRFACRDHLEANTPVPKLGPG